MTAAFDTLRAEGFSGTSARAIAERGGFNQAQVFYYFGSVNELLLAALERSSNDQLAAYRDGLAGVTTLAELLEVASHRSEVDLRSGHVRVLAELVSGSGSDPVLKARVASLVDPWLELTEQTLDRVLDTMGLTGLLPADQLAFVAVSLFLGLEMMVNLTGDSDRALDALALGSRMASLVDGFLPQGGGPP